MTTGLQHVGTDGRHGYCTGTGEFVNIETGLQHSTGKDGLRCCCSASRTSTVNIRGQTNLQQKNSPQQNAELQRNSLQRTTGRTDSGKICSDSYSKPLQQSSAAAGRTVGCRLVEDVAAYKHISQQLAGSNNKAHVTFEEKISQLHSRGFPLDNCDAVENAFPNFIHLLYDYQDIFS